ncbi:MAG: FecR domain-containing protein [Amaricoccus sp.]
MDFARRNGWLRASARVAVVLLGMPAAALPVDGPLETVIFQQGDTIRGVADRYLKDPDLWPQILELSGVGSAADLKPGSKLLIPVEQVAAADGALATSLVAIQKANAEGARIFAPVEIGKAIENRDTAVERRGDGAWAEVVSFAGTATEFAGKALTISLAQRDRSAEAVVSDAQGDVEGRSPDQPRWSPRSAEDVLVEYERLRTLSDSTAQVTFRDLSRLRLNPNSNAIIQKMRSDPLTGGDVTKVSLVNGDFYALLNQLGDRSNFEVSVPGLETETQSADFWVKHDGDESRFTNYDKPALEVSKGDQKISIGENEGAVVEASGTAEKTAVLARTELVAPFDGAQLYEPAVTLEWKSLQGAEGYWLEVAADPNFNTMQASEWGLRDTSHRVEGMAAGDHYWRVSSLDRLGLPGVRSLAARFRVIDDRTPPFVSISAPKDGEIVTGGEVTLEGESEPGAKLTVNGSYVPVGDNGRFTTAITATPGENAATVVALDAAGNRTERTRSFVYRPGEAVRIGFDPATPRDPSGALLTRAAALDVVGTSDAEAGSAIRVTAPEGTVAVQALAGDGGGFRFTVPASADGIAYRIEIAGPTGAVEGGAEFTARQDAVPPGLALDAPPPAATGQSWLDLAGSAGDAASVTVNGVATALAGGRFTATATLAPGTNPIEIVATDAVGNVAVQRVETVYDAAPPEIVSAEVGRPDGPKGPIEVTVEAHDASGLRQAAPYVLEIGAVERRGFLRCDNAAGQCRDTLPAEPGTLKLVEVTIEDYAGNAARRQE